MPYGSGKGNVWADSKGLLVGDAAGFADPITGEGIYYAIREAQLAFQAIMGALGSDYGHLASYNEMLRGEFMKEMICAKQLAHVLYKFPKFSYRILKSYGEGLGQYHVDVISGKKTYQEFRRKMLRIRRFRVIQ